MNDTELLAFYRRTLQRIANPLQHIADDASAVGAKLDGAAALALANDPDYLKAIARRALSVEVEVELVCDKNE